MKSVCVFCGSNIGSGEVYSVAARALAEAVARRGLRLVYGGGSFGLMGVLGEAALARLLTRLASEPPPRVSKWLDRDS